jgi:uncharacterized cupredoxin-like copper-binding protein
MLGRRAVLAAAALAGVTILVATACSGPGNMMNGGGGMMGGGGPAGSITVQLRDWSVSPSQSSTRAGTVTFHAVHAMMEMMSASQGGKTHALTVARKNDDGTYEVLGSVWDIGVGQSKDLTLDLSPGNYELQCNVVEEIGSKTVSHYKQGMHTPFTVTA